MLPASAMDQETAYLKSNAGGAYEALGGLLAGGKGRFENASYFTRNNTP